jgi:hypothetical protein
VITYGIGNNKKTIMYFLKDCEKPPRIGDNVKFNICQVRSCNGKFELLNFEMSYARKWLKFRRIQRVLSCFCKTLDERSFSFRKNRLLHNDFNQSLTDFLKTLLRVYISTNFKRSPDQKLRIFPRSGEEKQGIHRNKHPRDLQSIRRSSISANRSTEALHASVFAARKRSAVADHPAAATAADGFVDCQWKQQQSAVERMHHHGYEHQHQRHLLEWRDQWQQAIRS